MNNSNKNNKRERERVREGEGKIDRSNTHLRKGRAKRVLRGIHRRLH